MVIFTDALSILSKLQNPRQKYFNDMETALADLAAQTNLTLHGFQHTVGSKENEQADRLPRERGQHDRRGQVHLLRC